ncbi:hypothetical protein LSH36_5g16026 [Paralvinella palmiformis]|uniref:Uncharacterized protein n=1 Tax=Paralvinella palmiformis TaxID=53620 RepID=A0AAD9KFW0_9ANNE|nr:hypothetical protein LSH36_5g16026 [Paralvinella palmiformis]
MGSNTTHMMGYDQLNNASAVKGDRHARSAQRVNKRNVSEAVSSLLTLGTIVSPTDAAVQTVLACDDIAGIESDRLLEPNSSLNVYSREWYKHLLDKVPFLHWCTIPSGA